MRRCINASSHIPSSVFVCVYSSVCLLSTADFKCLISWILKILVCAVRRPSELFCMQVCVCMCVLIQQSVSQTGSVASILLVCMCKAKKGLRHTSMTLRLHYLCDTTTARSVVITEWRCIIATMELQRRITCITQCVCHEGTHAFFLFLQARRWLSVWLPHVPNCDNNPHKLTNCPGELHGRAALPTSGGHENNMHKFKYI